MVVSVTYSRFSTDPYIKTKRIRIEVLLIAGTVHAGAASGTEVVLDLAVFKQIPSHSVRPAFLPLRVVDLGEREEVPVLFANGAVAAHDFGFGVVEGKGEDSAVAVGAAVAATGVEFGFGGGCSLGWRRHSEVVN